MTPTDRGDLAQDLLPTAAHLACLVHGDGDARDIHQTIARLTPHQRDALLVVLAALIDPDQPAAELLDFITWDEEGNTDTHPVYDERTLREIDDEDYRTPPEQPEIDEVAIRLALEGTDIMLSRKEQIVAIAEARRLDIPQAEIADRLRLGGNLPTALRAWERSKDAARNAGQELPGLPELSPYGYCNVVSGPMATAAVVESRKSHGRRKPIAA